MPGPSDSHLAAPDGAAGDSFGYSVGASANTVVVGAMSDDVNANTSQGSAYVFARSGRAWPEQTKLLASDGAAADLFGVSVAVSRGTAVIGAGFHNVHGGAAYLSEDPTTCRRQCRSRSASSPAVLRACEAGLLPRG